MLQALEADGDSGIEFDVADALPNLAPEAAAAALAELTRWLKALPLSRRPLCKARPRWLLGDKCRAPRCKTWFLALILPRRPLCRRV